MLVKLINLDYHSDTIIQFCSGDYVHEMRTFWKQIPKQIISLEPEETFEIPDDYMCKGFNLSVNQNPVFEFSKAKKMCSEIKERGEQREVSNIIFENFMDTVAKFCNYDRKGEMIRWQDANDHCM
jgi:hypothetical protein